MEIFTCGKKLSSVNDIEESSSEVKVFHQIKVAVYQNFLHFFIIQNLIVPKIHFYVEIKVLKKRQSF